MELEGKADTARDAALVGGIAGGGCLGRPRTMLLYADLLPGNLLFDGGRLAAAID